MSYPILPVSPPAPVGWVEDTRAPFPTFYFGEWLVGVTQDEESGQWFAIELTHSAHDGVAEHVPFGCPDWSTRPTMFATLEEAILSIPADRLV